MINTINLNYSNYFQYADLPPNPEEKVNDIALAAIAFGISVVAGVVGFLLADVEIALIVGIATFGLLALTYTIFMQCCVTSQEAIEEKKPEKKIVQEEKKEEEIVPDTLDEDEKFKWRQIAQMTTLEGLSSLPGLEPKPGLYELCIGFARLKAIDKIADLPNPDFHFDVMEVFQNYEKEIIGLLRIVKDPSIRQDIYINAIEDFRTRLMEYTEMLNIVDKVEGTDFNQFRIKAYNMIHATKHPSQDQIKQFKELIEHNIKFLNVPNSCGNIFHALGRWGSPIEFFRCIPANFEIDFGAQDHQVGNTPIMWAIANANNGMAMEMLHRASKNDPRFLSVVDVKFGHNTALHIVVGKGYRDISKQGQKLEYTNFALLQKMVELGADLNIQNEHGNTPLHIACVRRDLRMIQCLLDRGAKTEIRNNENQTPFDLLQISEEAAREILEKTASPYLLDGNEFEQNLEPAKQLFNR